MCLCKKTLITDNKMNYANCGIYKEIKTSDILSPLS